MRHLSWVFQAFFALPGDGIRRVGHHPHRMVQIPQSAVCLDSRLFNAAMQDFSLGTPASAGATPQWKRHKPEGPNSPVWRGPWATSLESLTVEH